MTTVAGDASTPKSERLDVVQLLRAVAAIMIVALHAHGNWELSLFSLPIGKLGAGVDIFFVISGFVMVYASRAHFAVVGGPSTFLIRRLIRIVPLYWFALTIRVVLLAGGSYLGVKVFPSAEAIIASFLFIPYDGMGYGDAFPFPILDLGWTLNYEIFFYVVFATFLFLPLERAVLATSSALLVGVLIGSAFSLPLPVSFWLQPIILEFVAGMFIAVAFLRGIRLPPLVGLGTAVLGLLVWMLVDLRQFESYGQPGFYSFARLFVLGAGGILLMIGATLTRGIGLPRFVRPFAALGESSYALYLLHPFIFLGFKAIFSFWPPTEIWNDAIFFFVVATTITIAHLFYLLVEMPINILLRNTFIPVNRNVTT